MSDEKCPVCATYWGPERFCRNPNCLIRRLAEMTERVKIAETTIKYELATAKDCTAKKCVERHSELMEQVESLTADNAARQQTLQAAYDLLRKIGPAPTTESAYATFINKAYRIFGNMNAPHPGQAMLDERRKDKDELTRLRAIVGKLDNLDLAQSVARKCNDPQHDDRWCATCSARFDGIDDYQQAMKAALAAKEKP